MLVWLTLGILIIVAIGIGVLFGGAPFVPTRRAWIEQALTLSRLGKNDVIVDLGSGNGAVLALALERGAKYAVGYEINPGLALWSRLVLRRFKGRFSIRTTDFFRSDLPIDTTVIYMFQTSGVMRRITPYLLSQKPHLQCKKLRVVCFGFAIPGERVVRTSGGMNLYEF